MFKKFNLVLSLFSIVLLLGCAGVTEFDKHIQSRINVSTEKMKSCFAKKISSEIGCSKTYLADIQSMPDSYLKPVFIKFAESILNLVTKASSMTEKQFDAELSYIIQVKEDEALYAIKAERSRRESDFMRRLGNAGTAYNESMRQAQPQSPTRCNSQPDGMGGFTSVCR